MIKKLYDFVLRLSAHRWSLPALALISFFESSVFPIPPDVMLIPMILAKPNRAFLIAGVCLIASVLGGLFGYLIGALAFESLGKPILDMVGGDETAIQEFSDTYNQYGAWAVLISGLTPFPYKVITILSGVTGLSIPVFIASSLLARGLRFFIIATLLWRYGDVARIWIERHLMLITVSLLAVLIIIYLSLVAL